MYDVRVIFVQKRVAYPDCLGIDSPDEEDLADIDRFVERVSIAYLNFIDFMDFEMVDQYVC